MTGTEATTAEEETPLGNVIRCDHCGAEVHPRIRKLAVIRESLRAKGKDRGDFAEEIKLLDELIRQAWEDE